MLPGRNRGRSDLRADRGRLVFRQHDHGHNDDNQVGAGTLHLINVNTKGTVASTIVAYDSLTATGTKIATIDSLNLSGAFQYDIAFATGLTVITTGTAAPDITISYR